MSYRNSQIVVWCLFIEITCFHCSVKGNPFPDFSLERFNLVFIVDLFPSGIFDLTNFMNCCFYGRVVVVCLQLQSMAFVIPVWC